MVFVQMEDVLGRLVEIVVKYDLADLNKFYALFMDKVRYDKLSIDLGHTTQSASPLDIFLQTVIVEIRLSAIAKFPGFISPRRFRK